MDSIKIWFILAVLALLTWLFVEKPSLTGHLLILIWLATAAIVIHLSKTTKRRLSKDEKIIAVFLGILICIFSFTSIQLGIGNPPYSIDDFSVLISGVTLILLAVLGYRELLLPSLIPFFAFVFFHIYDRMRSWMEGVGAPLEMPVVMLTVFILKLMGIGAYAVDNVVMFATKTGEILEVPIVFDCTGVESMGAYLLTAGVIFYYFKKMPRDKKIIFLAVGIVGTYLANILRVIAICLTGYYNGYGATTELAHVHLGWVIFAIWMLIYWSAFFFTYRKFEKGKGIYSKNEQK